MSDQGQGQGSQPDSQGGRTPQLLPPRPPDPVWGKAPMCLDPRARPYTPVTTELMSFYPPATQLSDPCPPPSGPSSSHQRLPAPRTPYRINPVQEQEIRDENELHRQRVIFQSNQLLQHEQLHFEREILERERQKFHRERSRRAVEYGRQRGEMAKAREEIQTTAQNQAMIPNRVTELSNSIQAHEAHVAAKERALDQYAARLQEREAKSAEREKVFHENVEAFLKKRGDLPL